MGGSLTFDCYHLPRELMMDTPPRPRLRSTFIIPVVLAALASTAIGGNPAYLRRQPLAGPNNDSCAASAIGSAAGRLNAAPSEGGCGRQQNRRSDRSHGWRLHRRLQRSRSGRRCNPFLATVAELH